MDMETLTIRPVVDRYYLDECALRGLEISALSHERSMVRQENTRGLFKLRVLIGSTFYSIQSFMVAIV